MTAALVKFGIDGEAAGIYEVMEKHGLARLIGQDGKTVACAAEWVWAMLSGEPHPSYLDTLLTEVGAEAVEAAWRSGGQGALQQLWFRAGQALGERWRAEDSK